jgi:mutator protein MutT
MGGDSGIPSNQRVQEIVLAAIVDGRGRVLVQPRAGDPTLAGTWELPGGKVRPGENHAKALAREVEEETGVAVRVGELAVALCHAYADRRVALHAYLCEPVGNARPVRWGRWTSLPEYRTMPMPEANGAIVDALERALARAAVGGPLDSDSSISYK